MMQGGVLDHQRALDAVAQVASPSLLIAAALGGRAADDGAQLCERIDGTLDIRHGTASSLLEHPRAQSQPH